MTLQKTICSSGRIFDLTFFLLIFCLTSVNIGATELRSGGDQINKPEKHNQERESAIAAILNNAGDDQLDLKFQLENQADALLNLYIDCKKTATYQLSESAMYLNYFNQIIIKNKLVIADNAEEANLTNRSSPRKLLTAQFQVKRATKSISQLYELYKASGGTADTATEVTPLPNPCAPVLAELNANVARQVAIQETEKEIFIMPKLDSDSCKPPIFPRISLVEGEQGKIRLAFLVSAEGTVNYALIATSSGFPILDSSALNGLRACHFESAAYKGRPLKSWMHVDYIFVLSK